MHATKIIRCCTKASHNLRSFVYFRPPLVIFLANLIIFTAALVSLSYWIQYNDMQNPDATKDWNMFLERFASMEVCLTGNKSYPFFRRLSAFTIDGDSAIDLPPQPLLAQAGPKLAVHRMTLEVELDNRQRHLLSNYSVLIGAISGKILGLRDRSSAYQVINITVVIPQPPRSRDSVCVEMVGPEAIFPRTRTPKSCHSPKFGASRGLIAGGSGGSGMSYMYIFKTVYWSSLFFCSSSLPKLRLKYTHNPHLTEMLSSEEKYVAEENLTHTAYSLAVLIACFIAYVAAFGAGRSCGDSSLMYRRLSSSSVSGAGNSSGCGGSETPSRSRNCFSVSADRNLLLTSEDKLQHQQQQQQQQQQQLTLETGRKLSCTD